MEKSRFLKLVQTTALIFPLVLSGCFSQSGESTKSINPDLTDFQSAQRDGSGIEIPLEDVQSQEELQDELTALSQSGTWDTKQPFKKQHTQKTTSQLNPYDFPVVHTPQVNTYIQLFTGKQRKSFAKRLELAGRFLPLFEKELAQNGLPKDLAYLAMVESGFNPLARSHANAVGLWQFMSGTGKAYNLNINEYVDERRNVEKSTRAAANYLGDLYQEFGDWHLAVAAYNAGPGKVGKGLKRYDVDNFWDLADYDYLHMETKRYVPKLIATILIARNPEKYGFKTITLDKPLSYDLLAVGPSMPLEAIALITAKNKKEIIRLNPELRRESTPANRAKYNVKIPQGTMSLAQNNMKRLHSVATTAYSSYKVKPNDTLAKICARYDINATTLLKVNNLAGGRLRAGKTLRIPYSTISYKLLPKGASSAMLAYKDDLILHKVKSGDTVSGIARKYHVSEDLIVSWNGLKNKRAIRKGQQLALFIDEASRNTFKQDAPIHQKNGTLLIAATKHKIFRNQRDTGNITTIAAKVAEKIETLQSSTTSKQPIVISARKNKIHHQTTEIANNSAKKDNSSTNHYYSVQNGDSLWTISRKFHISMTEIKEWNSLKSNVLTPGSTLKIKKG